MDAVMAGDEEVEAVARALAENRWRGESLEMAMREYGDPNGWLTTDARAAIRALDRVRSLPAGGTESEDHGVVREKVARAICDVKGFGPHYGGDHLAMADAAIAVIEAERPKRTPRGIEAENVRLHERLIRMGEDHEAWEQRDEALEREAEDALADLDRVIRSPASGTEGEDHEAGYAKSYLTKPDPSPVSGTEGENHEAGIPPSPWRVRCQWCGTLYQGECPNGPHVPSPVSGTEPDTAKLVEAAQRVAANRLVTDESFDYVIVPVEDHVALMDALAGISVDAGKTEER